MEFEFSLLTLWFVFVVGGLRFALILALCWFVVLMLGFGFGLWLCFVVVLRCLLLLRCLRDWMFAGCRFDVNSVVILFTATWFVAYF